MNNLVFNLVIDGDDDLIESINEIKRSGAKSVKVEVRCFPKIRLSVTLNCVDEFITKYKETVSYGYSSLKQIKIIENEDDEIKSLALRHKEQASLFLILADTQELKKAIVNIDHNRFSDSDLWQTVYVHGYNIDVHILFNSEDKEEQNVTCYPAVNKSMEFVRNARTFTRYDVFKSFKYSDMFVIE